MTRVQWGPHPTAHGLQGSSCQLGNTPPRSCVGPRAQCVELNSHRARLPSPDAHPLTTPGLGCPMKPTLGGAQQPADQPRLNPEAATRPDLQHFTGSLASQRHPGKFPKVPGRRRGPWTAAYQAPLSMGFSRQEYWSGVPLPSPCTHLTC